MKVKLQHVAHTRSGDKGNTSNIAVFAYAPELYPLLKEQLTEERFKKFYSGAITGTVTRYDVSGRTRRRRLQKSLSGQLWQSSFSCRAGL